ncbi:MAG: heme biosynthesis protein HemY [Caulobacteraceae bacterium]|nr:heme biosynthesis protein HemY [Caulobacteraceae bacterium]
MIRLALGVLVVMAVLVVALAMSGDPGRASLTWLDWRFGTTAAAAILLLGLVSLLAVVFWRVVLFVVEAPRRAARAAAEARRRQAADVITRGFLAVAAGDGAEARRLAQKASQIAEDAPLLVRVLSAQAAEAADDPAAAQAAYKEMLASPETRLAGRRGLMLLAESAGDREAALSHAADALTQDRTARWAWRALFEARLDTGAWREALELVDTGLSRKIVTPAVAVRARAALLAALAAELERASDPRAREQAVDHAVKAARLSPAFAPGPVMASRLLADAGKLGRAEEVIEQAWATAPHPALWLGYRDLRTDETPRERAQRLQRLIDCNPGHRESRILAVEQALLAQDKAATKAAVTALAEESPTARLCGLFARAAWAQGAADEARAWIARGAQAAGEPDWSDLDPEGRAFAYAQSDWTRLVSTWAETGVLLHPRFERRERALTDLPELPGQYEASAPFLARPEAPAFRPPDDPGAFDDDLAGPPETAPAAAPAPRRRRRPARKDG